MPRTFSMAQMKVPSTFAIGVDGSRPRLKNATEAVRSGAAIGVPERSRIVNRIRLGPHTTSPALLISNGTTVGACAGAPQPGTSSGTVGAVSQAEAPEPDGRLEPFGVDVGEHAASTSVAARPTEASPNQRSGRCRGMVESVAPKSEGRRECHGRLE